MALGCVITPIKGAVLLVTAFEDFGGLWDCEPHRWWKEKMLSVQSQKIFLELEFAQHWVSGFP